jgi:hypothetical protein
MNISVCQWQALPNKPNLYAIFFLYSFEKEICTYRCKGYSLCVIGGSSCEDLHRPGDIHSAFELEAVGDYSSGGFFLPGEQGYACCA